MMKSTARLVCLATFLVGCVETDYDIRLEPSGNSLARTLTVRPSSQPAAEGAPTVAEHQARIAGEYQTDPPLTAKSYVYKGHFAGRMPTDVGGHGTFTRWETPLGSAAAYVERFRGNDDAAAELKRRHKSSNRLVDLLIDWLDQEIKADPNWPPLRRFLQEDFRRDLHNLSIYAWTYGLTDRSEDVSEPFVRATQYLLEHKYFTAEEIPAIKRAIEDTARGNTYRLVAWSKRLLVAQIGADAPQLPDTLSTSERLTQSLSHFLETTEEYAELRTKWEEQLKTAPASPKPEGTEVLGALVMSLFFSEYHIGGDRVKITLKTGGPVIATNGRWSVDSSEIAWPAKWLSNHGLPPLVYAAWDEPNDAMQSKHFGKVVLRGENLLGYCIWYHGLTAEERDEWDSFVDGRQPGPALARELKEYRFRQEPAEIDKDQRLTAPAVKAILEGLQR